ncbi:hypothetical protein C481_21141 [Natrialba asiatica DSM 12278]|uniref:Uncharacterized protein n=2 Tax=Natrialba asiatica TaxID=64602 RepID=M0AEH0_NATA1|nr:hypothetical protein C481_21141 [Natrialba asiatica DSM 12278]
MSESKTHIDLEDSFVAPWGLANEERPLHYIWEGEIEKVRLKLAGDLEVKELFNIVGEKDEYIERESGDDGDYTLVRIPSKDLISSGYLSAIITVPDLHEEPLVGHIVKSEFVGNDWVETDKNLTFTTRPLIHIRDIPEQIKLENDGVVVIYDQSEERVERTDYPGTIEADMEQIGFNLAQVETEAWGEGELLSQEESVYRDLAEALIEGTTADDATLMEFPDEVREDVPVEIADETIKNTVEDFRQWLSNESLIEEYSSEEIERISEIVETEDAEFDMSSIYKHFEYLLMNSILDVVDRHPANNVQMQSPQTTIEIENRLNSFNIGFELSDKMGNRYESEVIEIQVEDKRTSGGIAELELNTNWNQVQIDPSELDELRKEIKSDL